MKRISCFAMLAISLFCLTACSFVHPEQVWTTVSQSKEGEPFYKLQVSGKMYQILYNDNGSANFTLVYEHYSGSHKEVSYYQVGITADKNGQIKPSESSMVLVKTEKVDSK